METGATRLKRGIANGIGANMLGGLAFIVPSLLGDFSSTQVTLGRYLVYGLLSLALFLLSRQGTHVGWDRRIWRTALLFALAGNIGYYFFLVLGVHYAGAAVTSLIVGTLPVTLSLYGNWRRREYPFMRLLAPISLIFAGLLLLNLPGSARGDGAGGTAQQLLGIACATAALALWTWYGVANAEFLRTHPRISASTWTTLTGVGTLVLTLLLLPLAAAGHLLTPSHGTWRALFTLIAGSLALGVGSSWCGMLLWNRATTLLPVSLAAQLIVFEPLSVLLYVFITGARLPSVPALLGIVLVVGGVVLGINRTRPDAPRHLSGRVVAKSASC